MKTNKKHLLIAGMATAAIVAPTAALADTAVTTTEGAEQVDLLSKAIEMIKPDGTTTYVHVDYVQTYLTEEGYELSEAGKLQMEAQIQEGINDGTLTEEIQETYFKAIQMQTADGEIRYVHSDYLEEYKAKGYTLTEQGQLDLDALQQMIENNENAEEETTGSETGSEGENTEGENTEDETTTDTGSVEDDSEETNTDENEDPNVVEVPAEGETNTDDTEDEKDTPVEGDADEDADYSVGATGPSKPADTTPVYKTEESKTNGTITSINIKDVILKVDGKPVTLDLNDYFKSTNGDKLTFDVDLQFAGTPGTVAHQGDGKLIINTSKESAGTVTTVNVTVTDGQTVEQQDFTITIDGNKNAKSTLPQTGSEAGGIAGALGMLLVAAGSVIAYRRK